MKRLRKLASMKTLYHGTNLTALKQIIADGGIIPNKGEHGSGVSGLDGQSGEGLVFLATTLEQGEFYAGHAGNFDGEIPIVLELTQNENVLLPDNDDMPKATTWQESADALDQVTVAGKINISSIKNFYVYTTHLNGTNYDMVRVAEGPFSEWEKIVEENKDKIYGEDVGNTDNNAAYTNKSIDVFINELDFGNDPEVYIYGSISPNGDITLSSDSIQDNGMKFEYDYGKYVNFEISYDSFLRSITNFPNLKKNIETVFNSSTTFEFTDYAFDFDKFVKEL